MLSTWLAPFNQFVEIKVKYYEKSFMKDIQNAP